MSRRNFLKTGLAGIGTLAFSRTAFTMQSLLPASEKKKWAIVYGTKCGSTKDAATWINEGLGDIADLIDVKTKPAVSDYENFIIGGWINAGNLINDVKSFVTTNKAALSDKIQGLFTVCGNNGATVGAQQISNYLTNQIVKFSGVTDKPAKLFNGRSDPACNGLGITYDKLKKEDCVAFGQNILTTALAVKQQSSSHRLEIFTSTPTPANPITTIRYSLPVAGTVMLTLCDLRGKTVATLSKGHRNAGIHEVPWDTRSIASGHYLCRLEAGAHTKTRMIQIFNP
jgi:flavodoxin